MNINDAFQSKYLKSSDIQGVVPVQIVGVTMEDVGTEGQPEHKPVLHLHGSKPMILNRTNARTLADMFGDDTDGWTGKTVHLFTTSVDYRGSMTKGLRIAPTAVEPHINPMPGAGTAPQPVQPPTGAHVPEQSHWAPGPDAPPKPEFPPNRTERLGALDRTLTEDEVQGLQTALARAGKAESELLGYLGQPSIWAVMESEKRAAWEWIKRDGS